jgi:hypothetical protein
MKNFKYIIGIFLSLALLFSSCQDDDFEVGDITTPTNVKLDFDVIGQDDLNPNGDGDGFVSFTASADNVITFKYIFGDGTNDEIAPNGNIQHRFTQTGDNTYTVTVLAYGTAGVSSSTSVQVTVFSSFEDLEAENFLSGANVGDSKTWYWAASVPLHVGLGPVTDDYGNGEFAYEAWWNAIQPYDEEKSCMYVNEFVFTKTDDGLTFEQTVGPAFIPGTYAGVLGVDGDACHGEDVATTMFGVKNISFFPSSSKAAIEGVYDGEPYRGTSFNLSDGGFMGWYVGASTYDIISISDNEIQVRIIELGDGFAWYHKFTTENPN